MGKQIKTTPANGLFEPFQTAGRSQISKLKIASQNTGTFPTCTLNEPIYEEEDENNFKPTLKKQEARSISGSQALLKDQIEHSSILLRPQRSIRRVVSVIPIIIFPSDSESQKEQESFKPSKSRRDSKASDRRIKVEQEDDDYLPKFYEEDPISESSPIIYSPHSPILFSKVFQVISESDFRTYADSISRSKVYSLMLVNQFGNIIYSDKLGHQFFEGSLNNFKTIRIQNLLLQTFKSQFLSQLRAITEYNQRTIFNWIIYSKNTKRRYSKVPFSTKNSNDIFFRFLKCLTLRIRPVKITQMDSSAIEGFWNTDLISKTGEYFMLETRLCSRKPSIPSEILRKDPVLERYIKANSQKAGKWLNDQEPSDSQSEERQELQEGQIFMEFEEKFHSLPFQESVDNERKQEDMNIQKEEEKSFNMIEEHAIKQERMVDETPHEQIHQLDELQQYKRTQDRAVAFGRQAMMSHERVKLIGKISIEDV